MGKEISLYCAETASLKLGPGETGDSGRSIAGQVIVFDYGFATFDEAEFPDWQSWVNAPGSPAIRVVDDAKGEATGPGGVACGVCGKSFASDRALNGHLLSHRPRKAAKAN